MSSYYGNFAAYAAQNSSLIAPVLEVDLNDASWRGGTQLYLSGSVATARGNSYDAGRVGNAGWSEVKPYFEIRGPGLATLETTVTVNDSDGLVKAALENGSQRGSAARIYYVVPGNATDYAIRFTGMLDSWEYRIGETTLKLRTDDRLTRTYFGHGLTKSEWPNIPTASKGLIAPAVYGVHNSSGLSGTGMLPAICVDFTAGSKAWYIGCAGEPKLLRDVWKNGILQTAGGVDYTRSYATTAAGRVYSVIKFVSIPAASDIITVDIDGYETTGNTAVTSTAPTGNTILNPVEQMRHFLINFAEYSYTSGAWYTTADSDAIDAQSWAEAAQFAERIGLEGAGYLGGDSRLLLVRDVFDEWLRTWQGFFRAYWTRSGTIGLRVLDLTWPGYRSTTDAPMLRTEHELDDSFSYTMETTDVTDSFAASYLFDQQQGIYVSSLEATDPDVGEQVSSSVDMVWSIRRAV